MHTQIHTLEFTHILGQASIVILWVGGLEEHIPCTYLTHRQAGLVTLNITSLAWSTAYIIHPDFDQYIHNLEILISLLSLCIRIAGSMKVSFLAFV
jgi:hypothetical protein